MKSLYLTIISLLISLTTFCELPNTFKYQAVIRNADGETLANKDVTINLIILKDGSSSVYSEEHNVTTNSFGLVNLEVGSVTESEFADIDWSSGSYQLAIEMDGTLIGTTDLLAVPYAISSKLADNLSMDAERGQVLTYNGTEWTAGTASTFSGDYDDLTSKPVIISGTNTAVGDDVLILNTSGEYNTAVGNYALDSNTTGSYNTAVGYQSLSNIITNSANTAIGYQALTKSDSAGYNTAVGYQALRDNTKGFYNTSVGSLSNPNNISGSYNVGCGLHSLKRNTTGNENVAIGHLALEINIAGSYNTAIGYDAGPTSGSLTNTIAIGNTAKVTASNTAVIGNSSVTKLYLGSTTVASSSDGRFKENVKEDVPGLDFINLLRPVTFTWDLHKLDEYRGVSDSIYTNNSEMEEARLANEAKIHTGFIAQEVEAAADSVDYEFSGVGTPENENSIYTLSYSEFVVPLVKAVQEQQAIIEEQQKKLEELDALKAELAEIKELLNTLSE